MTERAHIAARAARMLAWVALALCAAAAGGYTLLAWLENREAAPVSQAEARASYERTLAWLKHHQASVMLDDNLALWWMVQAAGHLKRDPYLLDLAARQQFARFGPGAVPHAHKRMLDPAADIVDVWFIPEKLEPYQRFFFHALSCKPLPLDEGDTSRFLHENMCRPQLGEVLFGDPACTTHQYIGFRFLRSVGCPRTPRFAELESELLDDIEHQLVLDPVFKDAYLQRVLMLIWSGRQERVKPIWIRRVMKAQQADGGWMGYRQIPEIPGPLQPWTVREQWAARFPGVFKSDGRKLDFHATAQGLLIMALLSEPPPAKLATSGTR